MRELLFIQQNLSIRKDKTADKGRFKYRTAEGILEAVKPLLAKTECTILLTDDIWESPKGSVFVKSYAALWNMRGKVAEAIGYALVDEHINKRYDANTKQYVEIKSMSNEQIIGSASSYARKYALCGLLAIDDSSQDPDGFEFDDFEVPTKAPKKDDLATRIANAKSVDDINQLIGVIRSGTKENIVEFNKAVERLHLEYNKEQGKYIVKQ